MNKRIIPLLLCLTILIGLVPFSGVIAVSSDPDASKYSSYADYIGNVAEFNEYYPIPISNEPRNVDNPWSDNDCKFLLKEDVSNDLLLTIKSYYCSSDGSLWYMVSAAPGYELPQKLQDNPWIYQDDIFNSLGESLKISDFGDSAVFDVYGNKVNSVQLPMYGKVNLKCRSSLVDRVTYRWQVCCDKNQDLWVNLYGQIGASVTISYGMVAQRIDENGFAHIRCVSTSGDKTVVGEDIPVQIIPNSSASRLMYKSPRAVVAAENEQNTDSIAIHNVIIEYVFENGTQAANPWTATIEDGGDFKSTVKSPDVVGYTPNKTEFVLDIQDITKDLIYTVTYSPAEVDFIVSHQIQNALDDDYTEYKRISAKGYTDSMVGSNLALSDEEMAELGIYALPYDIEQKIAADSSTEIVIKYDRLYFLMNFALNGGYNVEPIYARVETPISVSEPIRAGYIFKGWDTDGDGNVDSLPATMPPHDTSIRAVWEPNPDGVNFFIAYWQENANDDNYTIAKVDKRNALAGTTYNGADTYGDMPGFHFDHADQNVLIKGDGSSVVNVYYNRNRYTLTFAYSGGENICNVHVHSTAMCCRLTCTKEAHNHTYEASYQKNYRTYYIGGCYADGDANKKIGGSTSAICGKSEHNHSNSCYDRSKYICGQTGVTNHSHSASKGCYGVKFEGIKYEQDTTYWWKQAPTGFRWTDSVSGEGYTSAPDMPNGNLLVIGEKLSNSYLYTIHYYEEGTTNKVKESISYYRSSENYYLTSTDYILIPGFTCLASGQTRPDNNLVYKIYYRRNSYNLSFKNGNELIDKGNWLYEADISDVVENDSRLSDPKYTGDDPDGFTFAGWYTDESCIEETRWDPEGATMPYRKMMLYAKWVPINHEIKLYITKEDYETGNQYLNTIVVNRNGTAQEPATPQNGSYHFVGWFYMENGVEKAYDFSIPVRNDMNLYGKWFSDELSPYTIRYAIRQGDQIIYIADDTRGGALAGYDKTFEAKSGNDLYEEYRTGYYPETNSHSMNILMDADNTYTFFYVKKEQVKYTVRYLEKETNKVLAPKKTAYTTEAIHTENFVYIDGGYRPDAYQKRIVLSANEDDNVITFWYVKDAQHAPVLVKHYLQNIDGVSYNTTNPYLSTTDLDALINSNYVVDIITTIEGFQFKSATASHEVNGVETNVETIVNNGQVSAKVTNEGLLIELYYDRIQYPYEFRFFKQGTDEVLYDPIEGVAPYGALVTQAAVSIPGYTCTSANQAMTIQSENGSAIVKNIRTFYYVEQTATIQYVPVGGGTTSPSIQTNIPVISGIVGGSTASPNEGYLFKGWYSDAACTQLLTTDLKFIPTKNVYGRWQNAIYYAKFEPNVSDLTIVRTNVFDDSQVYVYEVKNTATGEVYYTTITGSGQVTIKNLVMGEYTVTQQNDWSWRYDDSAQSIKHQNVNGTIVTFDKATTTDQWLNGNSQIKKNQRG